MIYLNLNHYYSYFKGKTVEEVAKVLYTFINTIIKHENETKIEVIKALNQLGQELCIKINSDFYTEEDKKHAWNLIDEIVSIMKNELGRSNKRYLH